MRTVTSEIRWADLVRDRTAVKQLQSDWDDEVARDDLLVRTEMPFLKDPFWLDPPMRVRVLVLDGQVLGYYAFVSVEEAIRNLFNRVLQAYRSSSAAEDEKLERDWELAAEKGKQISGPAPNRSHRSIHSVPSGAHVMHQLLVRRERRRQGYGTLLMRDYFEISPIPAIVNSPNRSTARLLERMGHAFVDRNGYVRTRDPARLLFVG